MRYSDEIIDRVRQANDIVDVVSERVRLKRQGGRLFGLCPFHAEKTPSFSVEPDRQFFYCFSCHKGGGVFDFLMEAEKLTFPESIVRLAERANITLPEDDATGGGSGGARAAQKTQKDRLYTLNSMAVQFFCDCLVSERGAAARKYLERRMIGRDTITRFGIGYAPDDWSALLKFLTSKGVSDKDIAQGGLATEKKNGGYRDRFVNRVMFPIQDVRGHIVAFGGRVLDDSVPKYMNSPETPVYTKGEVLFGLNLAKNTREKHMFIVEGYMDAIALSMNGIDNVVAPLGTALTESQTKLLRRYSTDVILAFDMDLAGQAAALRSLDILGGQGFRVRVLSMPQGKDPDEFIRTNGATAFRDLVKTALSLVDFKISVIRNQYQGNDIESRARFLKEAVKVIGQISDVMERELYITRVAEQYGITERSVRIEVEKSVAEVNPKGKSGRRIRAEHETKPVGNAEHGSGHGIIGEHGTGGVPAAQSGTETGVVSDAMSVGNAGNTGNIGNTGITGKTDDDEFFIAALLAIDNSLAGVVQESGLPGEAVNKNIRACLSHICKKASSLEEVSTADLFRFFVDTPGENQLFAKMLDATLTYESRERAMRQKIKDMRTTKRQRQMRELIRELESGGLTAQEESEKRTRLLSVTQESV